MHPYVRQRLRQVALARNAIFVGKASNRPLSDNYEEVGLMGEWAFAEFSGIMPRLKPGRGGDGGYDFEVPVVFTVDVKTARKADRLLVEAGKVKADIYVLAYYVGDGGDVELVGWCWSTQVKAKEPHDTGRGVINHEVPVGELRRMEELGKMMGKVRRG